MKSALSLLELASSTSWPSVMRRISDENKISTLLAKAGKGSFLIDKARRALSRFISFAIERGHTHPIVVDAAIVSAFLREASKNTHLVKGSSDKGFTGRGLRQALANTSLWIGTPFNQEVINDFIVSSASLSLPPKSEPDRSGLSDV